MKIKLNNIFKNKKQKKEKEEKIKSIPNEKFTRIRKIHTGNNINKNTTSVLSCVLLFVIINSDFHQFNINPTCIIFSAHFTNRIIAY